MPHGQFIAKGLAWTHGVCVGGVYLSRFRHLRTKQISRAGLDSG